jgi:hypothetical protein
MNSKIFKFLVFLVLSNYTFGQQIPDDFIMPDRPGLGESSCIVKYRSLQIETGANLEFDAELQSRNYQFSWNNTTIRYGIFQNFELRLAFNLEQSFTRSAALNFNSKLGFTPWSIGFKARVSEQKGLIPRTALLGNLAIPYPSAKFLKTKYIAPSMLIPMEWELSEKLLMTVNTGLFWNGNDAIPDYFGSFGFDYSLPNNFIVFVETYMNLDESGTFLPGFDGGIMYRANSNLQFDISAGIGLNKSMADGFVNAGISYRLSK